MAEPRAPDYPTLLHVGIFDDPVELPHVVLPIVAGSFVALNGDTYQVRETWFIHEGHGLLGHGLHVYLEKTDQQPPGRLPHRV